MRLNKMTQKEIELMPLASIDIVEWRKAVTITMLNHGKDPYDIKETIEYLEPLVFYSKTQE